MGGTADERRGGETQLRDGFACPPTLPTVHLPGDSPLANAIRRVKQIDPAENDGLGSNQTLISRWQSYHS